MRGLASGAARHAGHRTRPWHAHFRSPIRKSAEQKKHEPLKPPSTNLARRRLMPIVASRRCTAARSCDEHLWDARGKYAPALAIARHPTAQHAAKQRPCRMCAHRPRSNRGRIATAHARRLTTRLCVCARSPALAAQTLPPLPTRATARLSLARRPPGARRRRRVAPGALVRVRAAARREPGVAERGWARRCICACSPRRGGPPRCPAPHAPLTPVPSLECGSGLRSESKYW